MVGSEEEGGVGMAHRKSRVGVAQRHCPSIGESGMGRRGCLRVELSYGIHVQS